MSAVTIDSALKPRIARSDSARAVRAVLASHRAAAAAYAGGLPAEKQSFAHRREADRAAARATYLAGIGRRIHLDLLLRQRDKAGNPLWTIADPIVPVGHKNGRRTASGIVVGGRDSPYHSPQYVGDTTESTIGTPIGMPPLPPRARQLATDPAIRRRAAWVGVLYQPEAWAAPDPDPAIVVEWKDRPGEYYCLAIWGDDRPVIEEFLD